VWYILHLKEITGETAKLLNECAFVGRFNNGVVQVCKSFILVSVVSVFFIVVINVRKKIKNVNKRVFYEKNKKRL